MYRIQWFAPGMEPQDAFALRRVVFIDEQGFSPETELDEYDKTAHHVVFYDGQGKAAACGRVFPYPGGEAGDYTMGRIATRLDLRGTGLGRLLVEELARKCAELGARRIYIGAQKQAQGFYAKLGYEPYGENYFEEHCEHVHMKKAL